MKLPLVVALVFLLAALPGAAASGFSAEVSTSGSGRDATVTLAVNSIEVLTLVYTSTNHAVLANLAAAMTRVVRESPQQAFAPQSITVTDSTLIITLSDQREFKIPLSELVVPKVPKGELAADLKGRFLATLDRPPIAVAPGELTIPLGEYRTAQISGVYGLNVEALNPHPQVVGVEIADNKVRLTGLAEGTGEVILRSGFSETVLKFTVRKLAAYFPEGVTVELAGQWIAGDELREAMKAQLLASGSIAPHAAVEFTDLRQSAGRGAWEARVVAEAADRIKVGRMMPITLTLQPGYDEPSDLVLFSNDPEQLRHPGLLYHTNLLPADRARLVLHHQNRSGGRLSLRVLLTNLSGTPQRLFWRTGSGGPDVSTYNVGAKAAEQYLRKLHYRQGVYLTLAPHATTCLYDRTMKENQSVSSLMDLHLLTSGEFGVQVVAEEPGGRAFAALPPAYYGRSVYPPRYRPAVLTGHHTCELDGNWLFMRIGRGEMRDDEGRALVGDYGLLMEFVVTLVNSSHESRRAELSFDATGGEARGAFLINGELVVTPLVRPREPHLLQVFTLGPYERRTVYVTTLPAGGSHFPANLIVAGTE